MSERKEGNEDTCELTDKNRNTFRISALLLVGVVAACAPKVTNARAYSPTAGSKLAMGTAYCAEIENASRTYATSMFKRGATLFVLSSVLAAATATLIATDANEKSWKRAKPWVVGGTSVGSVLAGLGGRAYFAREDAGSALASAAAKNTSIGDPKRSHGLCNDAIASWNAARTDAANFLQRADEAENVVRMESLLESLVTKLSVAPRAADAKPKDEPDAKPKDKPDGKTTKSGG